MLIKLRSYETLSRRYTMKLVPGDQIQIILTVGGVPYAKTRTVEERKVHHWMPISPYEQLEDMMNELYRDIDQYGEESVG